ncbi:4-hydroxyphenylpyruvate dioxygenase [Nonomuraea spiralis]|uniref:4-hydroxyphenylpyruvate dioxygenase n=1 Tax=Nonomuraea TaxID=83681 RepID=UPI000F77FDA8|nr:4-hydroxyphenylpyruvate dioxygenase [Nonomuraea sp. WAC 01424]RSN05734.1 4-hydroxyphenylpyruvate dioxygenase [Nonomuraea sp. WAC 01424]
MATTTIFNDLRLDHLGFYVGDLEAESARLGATLGLAPYAAAGDALSRSVALGVNRIRLVLTQPLAAAHPGAGYLDRHGDGVADVALGVPDAAAAYHEAVRRGARPFAAPAERDGIVTAAIYGFGDVLHTFVQRPAGAGERTLPGFLGDTRQQAGADLGLLEVDHLAVCVPAGELDATVAFYRRVLGFELTFAERIAVGSQAMTTKVVRSHGGEVTFTLIEPDVTRTPGHIDEFLRDHGGAGVQHLALAAADIVAAVEATAARGVEFLTAPDVYYSLLAERVRPVKYRLEDLGRLNILVDEDHDGQLYQIFARSTHPRDTFFFELIERLGARSFGGGNISALYRAVELQRSGRRDARTEAAA